MQKFATMSSSMLGTVIAMLCLGVTTANCSSNRTCLDIQLVDMYGDGWDGEKFFIETPWNEMFSDAPTCGGGQVSHTFCTDASGNYPMMLIHENESYTPENYWEVRICADMSWHILMFVVFWNWLSNILIYEIFYRIFLPSVCQSVMKLSPLILEATIQP
jgi:hypothetical protein